MSFKYKVVQKTDVRNPKGVKRYYAVKKIQQNCDFEEFCNLMHHFHNIFPVDTVRVLCAMSNVLQKELTAGRSVNLDYLGNFHPVIKSESSTSEELFNSQMIKGISINYRPSAKMKHKCKFVEFKKEK